MFNLLSTKMPQKGNTLSAQGNALGFNDTSRKRTL